MPCAVQGEPPHCVIASSDSFMFARQVLAQIFGTGWFPSGGLQLSKTTHERALSASLMKFSFMHVNNNQSLEIEFGGRGRGDLIPEPEAR
jgi:hypothetical protein